MPSTRPCAAFEPISPNFDIKALVESSPNFEWVVRIHCDMIDHQGIEAFERLVLIHVIIGGKPLVIEGYHERLDRWTFALQWLKDNVASKVEMARDLTKKTDVPLSIGHYLSHMALLTNQWTDENYKDAQRQRMYLKDIDCPQLWHYKIRDIIPPGLFYLNESTGDIGGLGAVDESDPNGPGMRKGRGVARAGDLMSSLPKEMRAENMMCYIGHEGTYTPAHQEMCASLGQNIMVECSTGAVEDGKQTKPGSSLWFMTESKERHVVSEYWLSKLGHDIEIENHFAQINAWKAAPFKTYVVEQQTGDFILIPPLAPHQVWNRGTRTMKVAWNRTSVETLEMALHDALPRARMVCRDEQYKNKAIVYYSLQKYSKLLRTADKARRKPSNKKLGDTQVRQVEKDFRRLQALFTEILVSESFLTHHNEKKIDLVPFDSNITCSYCRCNIFNRFLTCPSCVSDLPDGEQDTYDICMECYAMGRSCACISGLNWVEQFPWAELIQNHEKWRHQILQTEGKITEKSPKSLKTELERLGRKRTLAQICQLELMRRPFLDISKPPPPVEGLDRGNEDETDINGKIKKRKVRRSEKFMKEHARCHVDMHWEPKWKQAHCSHCEKNYCYGVLFRAYDMLPKDILTDPGWKCPSCLNICGCRSCKTKPGYTPFTPSGTILGHNTKAVADPRSVESLVDFSFSNIQWIQKAGDDHEDDTRRLQKHQRAAAAAKNRAAELGDNYVEDTVNKSNEVEDNLLRLAEQEGIIPVDPALASIGTPNIGSLDDDDYFEGNPEEARRNSASAQNIARAPQFIVPVGGVIRDFNNAYDMTEAITYDYPDPDSGAPIVPPAHETEQGHSGVYELVAPNSPGRIEMVNRKRKREMIDAGDRPSGGYKAKKPATEKAKPKQRKSLIVSLNIDLEKSRSMKTMAAIAQKALNSVADASAPVVGSDLRALNAEWNRADGRGQAFTKRPRMEKSDTDIDDDFTPSRKRKTATDDSVQTSQHGEIPRRTTRMQAVTYEEPSDEGELNETVPGRPTRSKLATMEELGLDTESEPAPRRVAASANTSNLDGIANDEEDAEADQDAPTDTSFRDTLDSVLSLPVPAPRSQGKSSQTKIRPKSRAGVISNGHHQLNTAKRAQSPKISPAEIQANHKAKMAAFEWAEGDSESLEEWSEDERRPSPPEEAAALSLLISMEDTKNMPNLQHPDLKAARNLTKATLVQKASAADWGDDSSDDDGTTIHASAAWSSVNKPRSSRLKPATATMRRGRQPFGSKLA